MPFSNQDLILALKAAAEPTRLRILMLLRSGELTVKDLTSILEQSQPRISRHLKLLVEARLVDRFQEGSWAFFHLSDRGPGRALVEKLLAAGQTDDPVLLADKSRLTELVRQREAVAQAYFQAHADDWDRIRTLHVADAEVEQAAASILGAGPFEQFIDLGTGTGRMLELFSDRYRLGVGIDVNKAMLSYARARIGAAALRHAHVRHGDIYHLPFGEAEADAVVMHQVLHFLSDPGAAIREAARVLKPGGRLLVVDFAPHSLEFLRDVHKHERLGISDKQMRDWIGGAGLSPVSSQTLTPSDASDDEKRLTVSIWLSHQVGEVKRQRSQRLNQKIEEAV